MHRVKNWKDMNSWLKFFVLFFSICTVVMLGIGVREYLSGDLNRDYFYELFPVFPSSVFNVWDVWSVCKN